MTDFEIAALRTENARLRAENAELKALFHTLTEHVADALVAINTHTIVKPRS